MPQKITRISIYKAEVPIKEGAYTMSGGRVLSAFDTTFVAIETDGGLTGWGEVTPLGATYLPSYPAGARVGIAELAPQLIGRDATLLDDINRFMDQALKGHPYVKSALDMACWDILGKEAGLPASTLLGGRFGEDVALYRSITSESPEAMAERLRAFRAEGYRHFQLKMGGDPDIDIARVHATAGETEPGDGLVADANGGWLMHEAARVVRGVRDLDVYIEQPCVSYEECLTIRRRTDHPFILDESMTSVAAILRAHRDGAMDGINLKISKLGGVTRARQVRDLCVALGIAITIEDTAATDVTSAAIMHLAHSTPPEMRLSVTIANVKLAHPTADGAPRAKDGRAAAPTGAGLGVEPLMDVLGDPIFRTD
jgi:L-alanine-DL-glutamate epimerase-like enolase superfamily enzyme